MSTILPTRLEDCFGDLSDPRMEGCCDHQGLDILLIAIGGVLCGAESGVGIETAKASGFRQFLSLEHGIRSHETFGSGFAKIDHVRLGRSRNCCGCWLCPVGTSRLKQSVARPRLPKLFGLRKPMTCCE